MRYYYYSTPVSRSIRWKANVWPLLFISFLVVTLVSLGFSQLSSSLHSRLDDAVTETNGSVGVTKHYPHRHGNNSNNQERELFSLVTRQCSLSANVVEFRYNATSGYYYPITQDNQYDGHQRQRGLQEDDAAPTPPSAANHGFSQKDGAIVEMRACWCTEVFFQRPIEYCLAKHDTCIVRGSTGPVRTVHVFLRQTISCISHNIPHTFTHIT